jgi:peptidylamidoglycolate lyase
MFTRRKFITAAGLSLPASMIAADSNEQIVGHGDFKYRVDKKWAKADPKVLPVNDCHEMVQVPDGRLFLLTNNAKNNMIIFDTDGNVKGSWTLNMKGAHGLTVNVENEIPYLYLTDTRGRVVKTDLEGKVLLELKDKKNRATNPTETAIGPNGDIYVIDGYGTQYIYQYDSKGKFIKKFGGKSTQPVNKGKFMQAHGIALDTRGKEPLLLCTARLRNEFHWYTLKGKYVKSVYLPGVYMSRPVIHGENIYSGVCFGTYPNDFRGWVKRGFIVILDKDNKVVSAPGAHEPKYNSKGQLQHLYQQTPVVENCHDVCVDTKGDMYACQWNAGRVYPYKFTRIKMLQ